MKILGDLFKPFFTTKAKGMGLGLTVCKNIIEGHGGSIVAESKKGFGSCFTVKIPEDQSLVNIHVQDPHLIDIDIHQKIDQEISS